MIQSFDTQRRLDRMAISASTLCAAHCLASPVLIILVPILASTAFADEAFHRWMLLLVVPTSVPALWLGFRRYRRWIVLHSGLAGLALISAATFWGHALPGEFGEKAATVAGGLMFAAGHLFNDRLCCSTRCVG